MREKGPAAPEGLTINDTIRTTRNIGGAHVGAEGTSFPPSSHKSNFWLLCKAGVGAGPRVWRGPPLYKISFRKACLARPLPLCPSALPLAQCPLLLSSRTAGEHATSRQ